MIDDRVISETADRLRWRRIAAYYRAHVGEILNAGQNHWGIDPYQWEFEGGIWLTPIERLFWNDIRCEGVVLYPQYPVGRFFVDFANPCARVAIECDGAAYHQDKERDATRQREIEASGWRMWRLTGSQCARDDYDDEDEYGRARHFVSPGRQLLREIVAQHDISVGGRR